MLVSVDVVKQLQDVNNSMSCQGSENSERVVEVGSKEWVKHEKNMPLFTGKHEEVGW